MVHAPLPGRLEGVEPGAVEGAAQANDAVGPELAAVMGRDLHGRVRADVQEGEGISRAVAPYSSSPDAVASSRSIDSSRSRVSQRPSAMTPSSCQR